MFLEIKDVVSVRDAASFYGLNVNNNGMCVCPFHADKNPSMKVDKRFHCFGGSADGDVINFVQLMFNLNAKEAAIKIIEDFHLGIDTGRKETETQKNKRIRTGKKKEYEKKIREVEYCKNACEVGVKLVSGWCQFFLQSSIILYPALL